MEVDYSKYTSKGGRENNEDSIGVAGDLFIVADGLGGHSCGEVASANVVDYMTSHYADIAGISGEVLGKMAQETNAYIWNLKKEHPEYEDMASTVVAAMVKENRLYYMNVGDSRMYLFRKGKILRQTKDHSLTQLCVDSGEIKPSEMRFHEDRNKLTRVLGLNENLKTGNPYEPVELEPGDAFLLCSDGFWEYITEEEMIHCLKGAANSDEWLSRMLERVNAHVTEGNDNLSAICGIMRENSVAGAGAGSIQQYAQGAGNLQQYAQEAGNLQQYAQGAGGNMQQYAPAAGHAGAQGVAKKAGSKNKKPLIFAILAAAVAAVAAIVILVVMKPGKKAEEADDGNVHFSDFMVERCVKRMLGKSLDEQVSAEEAAQIESLTLSYLDDMLIVLDPLKLVPTSGGYMDLSDLRYFTGLKELYVQLPRYCEYLHYQADGTRDEYFDFVFENTRQCETLYYSLRGLEALSCLTELETLALPYDAYQLQSYGYRFLGQIFAQMPNLKKVNFSQDVEETYQEWIRKEAGRDILITGKEDALPTPTLQLIRIDKTDNVDAALRAVVEQLPEDTEDLAIWFYDYEGEQELDMSCFAKFRDLKALAVWGGGAVSLDSQVIVLKNAEALQDLKDLSVLSLSGVSAKEEPDFLKHAASLRELSLAFCADVDGSCLQSMPELRELFLYRVNNLRQMDDDKEPAVRFGEELSKAYAKLPELRFLYFRSGPGSAYQDISKASKLETLDYIVTDEDDEAQQDFLKELAKSKSITTFIGGISDQKLDASVLSKMKSLRAMIIHGWDVSTEELEKFLKDHADLVAFNAWPPRKEDEMEFVETMNQWIGLLSGMDHMSVYTIRNFYFGMELVYHNSFRKMIDSMQLDRFDDAHIMFNR